MSIRLYIGNLPKEEVNRDELQAIFAEAGDNFSTKVIKDRKTGKCRGFGFVTVATDEEADQFIEKFNGLMFKDTALKIEKALPRSKNPEKEAQQWQTEGLIDAGLYAQLAERYQFSDLEVAARNRFVVILLVLGSLLLDRKSVV